MSALFGGLEPGAYALPEELLARLQSPALVVDLGRARANVERVLAALGDDPERWRAHVKTAKIPAVFRELARAGVRRFKCATTREAAELLAVLRAEGVAGADVLLARPLVGPGLTRLGELAREHSGARVSVLVEEEEALAELPEPLQVFLDLNPGMDRTGVPLADAARVRELARRAGSRLCGLSLYEGHLRAEEREEAFRLYRRLVALARRLVSGGTPLAELVTSGSPGFRSALAFEGWGELEGTAHRVSPGTLVLHDLRSQADHPDLGLEPAALVLARVVSRPAPDVVTCDAGSKSLAAEAGDPCAEALGRPELLALTPSEEHLPLRVLAGEAPARGAVLLFVPRHVCPTVNLASEALLLEGGGARVVPVSARGHELLA